MLHETGFRQLLLLIALILALGVSSDSIFAQLRTEPGIPKLNYEAVPNFFQLPVGENFVEPCGVAVNSKGHIYVFDSSGKFIRSIADDLFVTAHSLRIDSEDNLWTADVGAHVVLKLSPEGRVLLSLGRMRIPGDDVLHFNQPTDVAFDRDGNVSATSGWQLTSIGAGSLALVVGRNRQGRCMTIQKIADGAIHKLPADFRRAIESHATAKSLWADITPLARNEWICWVTSAKQEASRKRRIEVGIDKMRAGMRRPCCWPGCPHR